MIRVLIADDQAVIRDGLGFLVNRDQDIEVVACVSNGFEALEQCEKLHPDVVLMDIVMPVCDGIEGTRLIKSRFSDMKVIILTTFKDDENVSKALKNGADGFVLKDIETEDLILTVKSIAKGLRVIHEDAFDTVMKCLMEDKPAGYASMADIDINLTDREKSVIQLIVLGKSNKEISSELFLSEGRVRNMISAILSKLKLGDRTQLAVFAIMNNIV